MISTRGLVARKGSGSVSYDTLSIPEPGRGEVLVECAYVGICRTDIELLDGVFDDAFDIQYPFTIGHEWSGTISRLGDGVSNFAVGDHVIGEVFLTPEVWFGLNRDGAASDVFVAPASLLHKVPESIDLRTAALIEPFTVGYRAVATAAPVDGSHIVVVMGGGMIGQSANAIARANGALTIVVEPVQQKRDLALQMGADFVVDPSVSRDLAADIAQICGDRDVDVVIEASGHAAAMAASYRIVGTGGTIVQVGAVVDEMLTAPLQLIQRKNLRIQGFTGAGDHFRRSLQFLGRHRLDLSPLISREFSFDEANEAIEEARLGRGGIKTLMRPPKD